MESGDVTGLELMERAGAGAVEVILARMAPVRPRRAIVLCGPRNNGGDGYVVARMFRARNIDVRVHAMGDPSDLAGDARENARRWDGPVAPLDALGSDWDCDLVVDALFGTGLVRPVEGLGDLMAGLGRAGAAGRPFVAALDLPSGICADSGRVLRPEGAEDADHAVRADLTIAFHAPKRGHVLGAGSHHCGAVETVDIGLPPSGDPAIVRAVDAPDPAILSKRVEAHKYDHGHALVLSGGVGRGGAARMAARAALRAGAGLVTLGVPPAAMIENAARLDAIMLARIDGGDTLGDLLSDARIGALLLGPGLGVDGRGADLVAAALAAGRPTLLDADALTLIAGDDSLRARVHGRCVATPHPGEFARLFPDLADRLAGAATRGPAFSTVDAAREGARRLGATLLLKGAASVIAAPDGTARISAALGARAAPWLATAGSGDVLAGIVAGLLARGIPPLDAASAGAWLHVEAARAFGPGLIAEDLPEMLPRILADLGA